MLSERDSWEWHGSYFATLGVRFGAGHFPEVVPVVTRVERPSSADVLHLRPAVWEIVAGDSREVMPKKVRGPERASSSREEEEPAAETRCSNHLGGVREASERELQDDDGGLPRVWSDVPARSIGSAHALLLSGEVGDIGAGACHGARVLVVRLQGGGGGGTEDAHVLFMRDAVWEGVLGDPREGLQEEVGRGERSGASGSAESDA
mmetsp:Transcript_27519/g.62361  ORF Transcript_27519/g.62361 Transcript_27519/m.62361 type:complete len:206 (-) Transcript_27519:224-841(-)